MRLGNLSGKFGMSIFLALQLLMFLVLQGHAAVVQYDWTVDYLSAAPDCVSKLVFAINGQFPSPTIYAVEGDTVEVKLKNALPTEGVVLHWHGIYQRGTPFYDGSAFVSQCPINPGETFTYKFTVDRAGTYFYHGHLGMQRAAGLFGSLIVSLPPNKKEPFTYDAELSIVLTDWWHKSIYEQQLGLNSIPFQFVGEPQSLLIQGRGRYNCSDLPASSSPDRLSCNTTNPKCSTHVLPVTPGKTYRLRIGSVASLSSLNFILEGHNMTVVKADARYVEPFVVENLDVYSGQTYDVVFTANQDSSKNYWAAVNVRGRKPSTPTGLAVLQYLPNPATQLPTTPAPVSPLWNDTATSLAQAKKILAKPGGYEKSPPKYSNRTVVILGTQNLVDGHTKWALNNISYVPKATPVLAAFKYNLKGAFDSISPPNNIPVPNYDVFQPPPNNSRNASYGSPVYVFKMGSVVDVVVQNSNTLTVNNSEIHPWHLHGHDFWVLGYGVGLFNKKRDAPTFNLVNPPVRNTVAVFPYGWVAIRFTADNPGAWPFHCHVEPHFFMGMGTVFAEGIHQIPALPSQTLGCGNTKRNL